MVDENKERNQKGHRYSASIYLVCGFDILRRSLARKRYLSTTKTKMYEREQTNVGDQEAIMLKGGLALSKRQGLERGRGVKKKEKHKG